MAMTVFVNKLIFLNIGRHYADRLYHIEFRINSQTVFIH
jgi:hypothetical protein